MHIISFNTEYSLSLEEGSILKYITSEYEKDTQDYKHLFQVIGNPIEGNNATVTHYTLPNTDKSFTTHIKVV